MVTKQALCKRAKQARGECRQCSSRAEPGRTMCRKHLDEQAERTKRKRNARVERGVCQVASCGRSLADSPSVCFCALHFARNKKYQVEYRAKKRQQSKAPDAIP